MIGKIVAFKPRSKGGGSQLAYLAGEAHEPAFTDYHSKSSLGIWALGSGLSALGLGAGDKFDPVATSRLAEGFHAESGAPLARNAGAEHRQGWDITIDDPKDFSLIHAFGTDDEKRAYYEARREAWRVVVSEIERLVRPKYAGHEGPLKIAMQVFEHDDSRAGDPHKHGHGFLFNVGVLPGGKTCAIDVQPVMAAKAYLGQVYQSELARGYAARGKAVAFDERESTDLRRKTRYAVARIPGLATAEQLAGFSERAAAIKDALAKEGKPRSVKAKDFAALATRDEKKLTHEQMRELWDAKARALGLDFAQFHQALAADPLPAESREAVQTRVLFEVEELSRKAIEGNGLLTEHEIAFAAARALRGHSVEHIRKAIDSLERQLVPCGESRFGRQFTTRQCVALEQQMKRQLGELAAAAPPLAIDSAAVDAAQAAWEARTGHMLTSEQRQAALHVVCGSGSLSNIEGEAGTGKSTLMEVAAAAWKANGLRVVGAAPTGKAAEALAASIGEAQTCARLLIDLANGRARLDAKTVLLVDECGMLATPPYAKLVEAARKAGAKLVCVGDRSQLAAIGMRGGFQAAIDAASMASISENRRQANAVAVGGAVGRLFRAGKAAEALDEIEREGRLTTAADEGAIVQAVAAKWIADATPAMGKMVLAELVETVGELNEAIRAARRLAGQLGEDREAELTTKDGERFRQALAVGDKIMFLQNAGKDAGVVNVETNRAASPKNGTAALIEGIRWGEAGSLEITARTEDGKLLRWSTADYSTFALGYAHSYHKSQGSTATNVYAVAEGSQVADLGLAYVGATRHKNDCHMFVAEGARQRWTERAAVLADARTVSEQLAQASEPPSAPPAPLDLPALLGAGVQPKAAPAKRARAPSAEAAPSPSRPKGHAVEIVGGSRLVIELGKAATRGDLAGIDKELAAGAAIDGEFGGMAALHRAAYCDRGAAVAALARAGASLEARTGRGMTALHLAAMRGCAAAAAALIEAGADLRAASRVGATPADLARKAGHVQLADGLAQLEAVRARERAQRAGHSLRPKPPGPQLTLGR